MQAVGWNSGRHVLLLHYTALRSVYCFVLVNGINNGIMGTRSENRVIKWLEILEVTGLPLFLILLTLFHYVCVAECEIFCHRTAWRNLVFLWLKFIYELRTGSSGSWLMKSAGGKLWLIRSSAVGIGHWMEFFQHYIIFLLAFRCCLF